MSLKIDARNRRRQPSRWAPLVACLGTVEVWEGRQVLAEIMEPFLSLMIVWEAHQQGSAFDQVLQVCFALALPAVLRWWVPQTEMVGERFQAVVEENWHRLFATRPVFL